MKTLLVALNSSYVHTNPAVRLLAQRCGAAWEEYNINQNPVDILGSLVDLQPDVAAFSCYIWNIGHVLRLAQDFKTIFPDAKIILCGPEVSFDASAVLCANPFVDAVVCGEAEEALPELLRYLRGDAQKLLCGVLMQGKDKPVGEPQYGVVPELYCDAPFAGDQYNPNKIYYYESTRGCPFHCAYCLSSRRVPVREKPIEQVLADIDAFETQNVKLVKFTDRTFNANEARAIRILEHISGSGGNTCFHFEVALDLMHDSFLAAAAQIPTGRVQFEAGVQSCNKQTLDAIQRKTDLSRVKHNAAGILEQGNIHLHLDLIAGLPYEGIAEFEQSFDQIYSLYPHHLQLGFLKLLKGTPLREQAGEYGIRYREYPPYEVLYTRHISARELFLLKGIAELVERYYNTGRARNALDFITKRGIATPFAYYRDLQEYCMQNGYTKRPVGAANQFQILIDHGEEFLPKDQFNPFLSNLKQDYINTKIKGRMPEKLQQISL